MSEPRCKHGLSVDTTKPSDEICLTCISPSSAPPAGYALTVDPSEQIKAWTYNSYDQWQFWERVVAAGTWSGLGKTKEQAENLVGYFEGNYDMAIKIRDFIAQKSA